MDNCILTMKDGIVTLNRVVPEKRVSFHTLVQTMMAMDKVSCTVTPLLPGSEGSCRLYAENDKAIGFLIQCNPTVRTFRFVVRKRVFHNKTKYRRDTEYGDKGEAYLFDLSMPWIWVFCKLLKVDEKMYDWRRCFICATYDNLESLGDRVYSPPMPNIWSNTCLMCTGDIIRDGNPTDKPAFLCRKFLYKLWDSYFNDDLTGAMPDSLAKSKASLPDMLGRWEDMTKENPGIGIDNGFGLKDTRWGGSLRDFVSAAMDGGNDDAR